MRTVSIIVAGCLFAVVAGCENDNGRKFLTEKIGTLRQENQQLQSQVEKSQSEVEQLKEQVQVLSDVPCDIRLKDLYDLERIKISRYTNLYDKDEDGKKEKLIVYIQPIDQQGDSVKAGGTVDVQLWNLDKEESEALLGEWNVAPGELKDDWFANFINSNYRLVFDVGDKITGDEGSLVVRVTFTDYLSGKVLKEQKIIKP